MLFRSNFVMDNNEGSLGLAGLKDGSINAASIQPAATKVTNIGYSLFWGASTLPAANYNSQLFTVLGNGIASLILEIPVRYMTHLSNPSPNPE